jgi:uncharacterized protein YggE
MPVSSKIVLATLLAMTASSAAAQSIETNLPTLVMVGEAEQAGNPDIAVVTLGIVTEREHAGAALHASGDTMRAVIGLARREGIEARDLQTSGLSLQPRYSRQPQRSGADDRAVITGYIASNQLSLRVRSLERLGPLLDKMVSAGSNDIKGLSFDVSDHSRLLDEARTRAVEDARRKARLFAAAAGIQLGDIINLQEESTEPQPGAIAAKRGMPESAGSVPVEAGEVAFRIRVRITWRIAR